MALAEFPGRIEFFALETVLDFDLFFGEPAAGPFLGVALGFGGRVERAIALEGAETEVGAAELHLDGFG